MAYAQIRGSNIHYEVWGDQGPWFVLTTGGRSGLHRLVPLAKKLSSNGYRVLLHDRRNTGASDVAISDDPFEDAMFADDVAELLTHLDAAPAIALGTAAGNRLCLSLATRHPQKLQALILCWPVGGRRACEILAETYYGQFIEVAWNGGMEAVCETPHYSELIRNNPRNQDLLLSMNVSDFISTMERWRESFLASAELPTMLFSEDQLRAITLPTCVVPGLIDDPIHGRGTSESVAELIPGAEVGWLPEERRPEDDDSGWLLSALDRRAESPELVRIVLDFAAKVTGSTGAARR
jgi:pimeloyl-ACP methyl ester carboxylesterase